MTFKYSLISDMHIDHPQGKTPYDQLEELVIVAGDTSNSLLGLKFLNKLKNKGHKVFAVDGNHEHYGNQSQGRRIFETEIAFYGGLDQAHCWADPDSKLKIFGCNGWYHVDDESLWRSYMNDHFAGSAEEINHQSAAHANWLKASLEAHEGKAIIVTHTAPCLDTLNPRFEGHFSNDWYWNPSMLQVLKDFADKILIWNHGHTHAFADKLVHGVRVVCNPRGYPGENPNWKPQTIKVEG